MLHCPLSGVDVYIVHYCFSGIIQLGYSLIFMAQKLLSHGLSQFILRYIKIVLQSNLVKWKVVGTSNTLLMFQSSAVHYILIHATIEKLWHKFRSE